MNIRHLKLWTNRLEDMKHFYVNTLEFQLVSSESDKFTVQVGTTDLTFQSTEHIEEHPQYHFAMNIPENQMRDAMMWLEERGLALLTDEGSAEIHFESWNAHSCYFLDPAGNIVELIARHNLANASGTSFGSRWMLCISEIGIPVDDVPAQVEALRDRLGVDVWNGRVSPTFTAVGDEHGLMIVVAEGRGWFPVGTPAAGAPLEVETDVGVFVIRRLSV